MVVPCSQCHGCRLDRSAQWAVRCVAEAKMHKENSFITLTYRDWRLSLEPEHLRLFWRRVRKVFPGARYYACGEYGDRTSRPHYHGLLFGVGFRDRRVWRQSVGGFPLFRSETLERLWPLGHSEIGDVSFESAAYVARYVMKKRTGKDAGRKLVGFDPSTGEVWVREHEFSRCSLKPGVGATWFEKFQADIYPEGQVVLRGGARRKAPRFFDGLYKAQDPMGYWALSERRLALADARADDNSPQRLRVKEIVERAKCSSLKREI